MDRAHQYSRLMRLDKPIGILLLLWPTLWALWVAAEGMPSLHILSVFVLGVILMRSAGCVINDFADRNIDGHVARTKQRPLASGKVSVKEALFLFAALVLLAFILVLTLDAYTIALSFVALLLAIVYPFTKRFISTPQVVLGIAFAWAIPMAFAAIRGHIPLEAWLLFFATVLWAVAYDTYYAMVDREDDLKIGVKSTAILFGDFDRLIIAMLHTIVVLLLFFLGITIAASNLYYLGLFVAGLLVVYQLWLTRQRESEKCFQAFLNNNWFGVAVFVGILLNFGFA